MRRRIELALTIILSTAALIPAWPQTPARQKPSFEVASVKANMSGTFASSIGTPGCRLVVTNTTLRALLQFAYHPPNASLLNNQIIGGPDWLITARFDAQAKPEGDPHPIPQAEMQLMVQSFLEDRFQLKAHLETRELPVYNLVAGKDRPKIKLAEDQTPPQTADPMSSCAASTPPPGPPAGTQRGTVRQIGKVSPGGMAVNLSGTAITMADFLNLLQQYSGRPIVDKTDFHGLVDISLEFNPSSGGAPSVDAGTNASDPGGASLFTAVQEQLGLKLESAKELVQVLVIDSVQKPSEN